MTWTGAFVLFAVIWFVLFLVLLPRGATTQGEMGEIEPGTPASAPAEINIARRAFWTTLATLGVLGVIALNMELEIITLDDFEFLYPDSFTIEPR